MARSWASTHDRRTVQGSPLRHASHAAASALCAASSRSAVAYSFGSRHPNGARYSRASSAVIVPTSWWWALVWGGDPPRGVPQTGMCGTAASDRGRHGRYRAAREDAVACDVSPWLDARDDQRWIANNVQLCAGSLIDAA
jgi:hypothetical protein